ncbi:hypothetical protein BpHYR1_049312 [Brachionus plicatilis]|uniref:Uncharacterized protein n=1 Tax=Brachionus plicatilis TaxID=10195 RepID=A0A3M7PY45_BRAPC|nr:hypothetical protein BpHYR1_049312 [Brachionus plicatilis]
MILKYKHFCHCCFIYLIKSNFIFISKSHKKNSKTVMLGVIPILSSHDFDLNFTEIYELKNLSRIFPNE